MSMIRIERDGAVATLVLDRPEAANVLDLEGARALRAAVAEVAADDDVHAVLLRGSGPRFCGGGDLASMAAADDPASHLRDLAGLADEVIQALCSLPKPVVAAVHGAVAGVGLALMLSADVTVAARTTKFVAGYSAAGLTPDGGIGQLLARAVGQPRALDFLLTGRLVAAPEALDWGLVTRIADDDDTLSAATALARTLAEGPTWALGRTRALVRQGWERSTAESSAVEIDDIATAVTTPQARELIRTFLRR